MIIVPLQQNNLSFKSGKSFLFTDFDGTLLPQSLHNIYNGNTEQKKFAVEGFNKYFSEIQNFSNSSNNNFEIIITTGRRLNKNNQDGFLPTYQKIRQAGITLPKIKEIITVNGGDIFSFTQNGDINPLRKQEKTSLIKQLTCWDNDLINKTIKEISQKLNTSYEFVDERGSYKLSLLLADKSKTENFLQELQCALKDKVQCQIRIGDVKTDEYSKTQGIKLYPLIDGQKLNKSFDVKKALNEAIKNNDFIIAAGDAANDKEMLNIFNYINLPKNMPAPLKPEDITPEFLAQTREQIDKLPIKLLFIKPNSSEKSAKKLEFYKFMQKQAELFPDKVVIVEETKLYQKNNFLNAIKNAIYDYTQRNPIFKNACDGITKTNSKIKRNNFKLMGIVFGIIAIAMIAYKKFFFENTKHIKND